MDRETKDAWVVLVNTDLTEGKGRQVVKAICETEATAVRIAHKADVQGSDGSVLRVTLERKNTAWFGPVNVMPPTADDKRNQIFIDARRDAEDKARKMGLTDDDLLALRR